MVRHPLFAENHETMKKAMMTTKAMMTKMPNFNEHKRKISSSIAKGFAPDLAELSENEH